MHPSLRTRRIAVVVAVAATIGAAATAHGQAVRTWVSGVGDDANPCSRTAPCKTLAGSISKTAVGGEINALDPGGFGAVTVTKSITIDLTPYIGGVLASSTNGVVVNADTNATVVLRGLDIFGPGVGAGGTCSSAMLTGVNVIKAGSVIIEDSRISNASVAGVKVAPTTGSPTVAMNGLAVRGSCGTGVGLLATPAAPATTTVSLRDSLVTGTVAGVRTGAGATAWLAGSMITGNALGLDPQDGVINTFPDTRVFANVVDGAPTTAFGAAGLVGPAGPAGPAGPEGPAGPAGAAGAAAITMRATSLTARSGGTVVAAYVSTAPGRGLLTVRRRGKVVVRRVVRVFAGSHGVRWNGRIDGRPAARGAYVLELAVTTASGHRTVTRTPLVVS